MQFVFNDGGRLAAGFKTRTNDCVIRAVAIAANIEYRTVYDEIKSLYKSKSFNLARGIDKKITKEYLSKLGWTWTPTMQIGSGCKVHLRADQLPSGRVIVSVSRHLVAMIDGVIHDIYDPTREGERCVYGYWKP